MHVAPLRHIIQIPIKTVFALTNIVVFDLNRPKLEHTIYCTQAIRLNTLYKLKYSSFRYFFLS